MADLKKNRSDKSERTLLVALLLSAPGPIITGFAAITSHSATQIADFLRRSAELAATFVSWWVFRRLRNNEASGDAYRTRLERITNLTVAGAMICSGIALFIVGMFRLFVYEASGNVTMGLIIAILGLLVNTWFWRRYWSLNRAQFDSVITAQQKLYRAKACVDFCVVAALAAVAFAPAHPVTRYVDSFGSIIVAVYLLYNGITMAWKNRIK